MSHDYLDFKSEGIGQNLSGQRRNLHLRRSFSQSISLNELTTTNQQQQQQQRFNFATIEQQTNATSSPSTANYSPTLHSTTNIGEQQERLVQIIGIPNDNKHHQLASKVVGIKRQRKSSSSSSKNAKQIADSHSKTIAKESSSNATTSGASTSTASSDSSSDCNSNLSGSASTSSTSSTSSSSPKSIVVGKPETITIPIAISDQQVQAKPEVRMNLQPQAKPRRNLQATTTCRRQTVRLEQKWPTTNGPSESKIESESNGNGNGNCIEQNNNENKPRINDGLSSEASTHQFAASDARQSKYDCNFYMAPTATNDSAASSNAN